MQTWSVFMGTVYRNQFYVMEVLVVDTRTVNRNCSYLKMIELESLIVWFHMPSQGVKSLSIVAVTVNKTLFLSMLS